MVIEADMMPDVIPEKNLILLKDDGDDWSVGFKCPCGCGDILELMLLAGVKPRWDIEIDRKKRPTLTPSVWRTSGCKSHFWVTKGKIIWV
jgi:hypothetical protein